MDGLDNRIWGPALWMILHSSAERIGTKSLRRLPHEEVRIWANLLSSLRIALPCPICRHHFSVYFQQHTLASFSREQMREWLFHLHSEINRRLEKSNEEWTLERVQAVYSEPFHFSKHYALVSQQIMRSFQGGWLKHEDMQKTRRAFDELKRYYDFF